MKMLALIAALLASFAVTEPRAAVEVIPVRLEETRATNFVDDGLSRSWPEATLILSLNGPEAEAAVRYGNIKLDEAVDDTGASLLPKKGILDNDKAYKEFDNAFFRKSYFGPADKKPAAPQVTVRLANPSRAAKRIARLRGSLSIADSGTEKKVVLSNFKGAGTKTLDIPPEVHVTITVQADGDPEGRSIHVRYSGNENAVKDLQVVDAAGKEVNAGMSSMSMNGGPVERTLELSKPLDNSMKIVATILMNEKITTIPFDLKDIPLP